MVASQEERKRQRIFLDLINISFACYFSPCAAWYRSAQPWFLPSPRKTNTRMQREYNHPLSRYTSPLTCTRTRIYDTPIRRKTDVYNGAENANSWNSMVLSVFQFSTSIVRY